MLCIGRGLMSNPKMIMLDEPSAALAPQIVLDIFKNINRIRKDGLNSFSCRTKCKNGFIVI